MNHSPLWFRWRLRNPGPGTNYLIGISSTTAHDLRLFSVQGERVLEWAGGSATPFSKRFKRARDFVAPVELEPGTAADYYLFARTSGAMKFQILLENETAWNRRDNREIVIRAVYTGLAVFIILPNILLGFRSRDRAPFLFAGLVTSFLSLRLALDGVIASLFFPESPGLNEHLIYFIAAIGIFCLAQLWKDIFPVPHGSRSHRLYQGIRAGLLLLAGGSLLPGEHLVYIDRLLRIKFYLLNGLLLLWWAQELRKGPSYQENFYSAVGLLFWVSACSVNSLAYEGLLPAGEITEYLPPIASIPVFYIFFARLIRFQHFPAEEDRLEKYSRSKIGKIDTTRVLADLDRAMRDGKPYRDPEFRLSGLAALVNVHPQQLSEILNASLNKNFNRYVNEFRIEEAREMLVMSPDSIHSIALRVGFFSKSGFNHRFKELTGVTPREYRTRNQTEREPASLIL